MRSQPASYHGYRFPPDIISHAVWLYYRAPQQAVGKMTEGPSKSAVRSRLLYRPRILGQWFDGIHFYAASSSPTRSRRTYRPGKSALDAVGVTRKRCWRYAWVVEFDIRGLFDNIPHALLLKAVRKHVRCHWALLYVERWLTAPQQQPDGCVVPRCQGTPQGGVVSPLLSNLFLHYVFDAWMTRHFPTIPWCRYADDGLFHCHSQQQAREICDVLRRRFRECGLELHPQKTKIVYCKDGKRRGSYPVTTFDFLGYTFRGRTTRGARGELFFSFNPAVSPHYSRRSRFESPVRMNRIATDGSDDAGSGYRPGVHAGARMPLGAGPATDSSAWGGPARANPEEGGARVGAIRAGRRARVRCVARHGGPASPSAGAGRCGGPSPRRELPT